MVSRSLALLVGLAAVAHANDDDDNADNGCNIVRQTETWVHHFQAGEAEELAQMYTRNAVRFENGHLSPFTAGKPFTAAQQSCIAINLEQTVELTHFTRDWKHHVGTVALRLSYGTEQPLDQMVTLDFDRHDCKIRSESYFYATDHPGYQKFVEEAVDNCFGGEINIAGPVNNLGYVRSCWSNLEAGLAGNYYRCYGNLGSHTVNGQDAPAYFRDRAYWVEALRIANFQNIDVSTSEDSTRSMVYAVVNGEYSVLGSSARHSFTVAQTFSFDEGVPVLLAETREVAELDPLHAGMNYNFDGAASGSIQSWNYDNAVFEFDQIRRLSGAPEQVRFTSDFSGFAIFKGSAVLENEALLGCANHIEVRDEAIAVSSPTDVPNGQVGVVESVYLEIPAYVANEQRQRDLQHITESITYDPIGRTITARGDTLGSATAQMRAALRVALEKDSLTDAQENVGEQIHDMIKTDGAVNSYRVDQFSGIYEYTSDFVKFAQDVCKYQGILEDNNGNA